MRYKREIKPSFILPPSYIRGFYQKDPEILNKCVEWVETNGLIILFTLQRAFGDETVWVDLTEHKIYVGSKTLPTKVFLLKQLFVVDNTLVNQAHKENWNRRKIFDELKKHLIYF